MTNKYLIKIASDLQMAEQFHKDEVEDVNKYTEALKKAKDPTLRAALQYALPQEKIHAGKFKDAIDCVKATE